MGPETFIYSGWKKYVVHLCTNADGLSWCSMTESLKITSQLYWRQILSTSVIHIKTNQYRLDVKYVNTVSRDHEVSMRVTNISFFTNNDICQRISEEINQGLLQHENQRPKNVLLFINPMSGNRNGVKNYQKTVRPLFEISNVKVKAIVTQNPGHAEEVLGECDLTNVDAVISMGGDASYKQVLTGLTKRVMIDAGLDPDSDDPIKIPIRFGTLPNGSGCAASRLAHSSVDLETSVISNILGRTSPSDIMKVSDSNGVIGFSCFCVCSGLLCSTFYTMDKHRWLGVARYWFTLITMWLLFCLFDKKIEYLPPRKEELVREYAAPDDASASTTTIDKPIPGWCTYEGKLNNVHIMLGSLCRVYRWIYRNEYKRPKFTGENILIIVEKCPNFRSLLKNYYGVIKSGSLRFLPKDTIEGIECKECRVTINTVRRPYSRLLLCSSEAHPLPEDQTYTCKLVERKLDIIVIDNDMAEEALYFEGH